MHRLRVTSRAVAPDFKVLLFPYRAGQEQPKTTWNADRTVLAVEWSDQKDSITFATGDDGRTRLTVTRRQTNRRRAMMDPGFKRRHRRSW